MTCKTLAQDATETITAGAMRIANLLGLGAKTDDGKSIVDPSRVVGLCRDGRGKFRLTIVNPDVVVDARSWGLTIRVEEDELRHDLSHVILTGLGTSAATVSSHAMDAQARKDLLGALLFGAFRAQTSLPRNTDITSMLVGTDRSGDVMHYLEGPELHQVLAPGPELYPYITLGTARNVLSEKLMLVLGLRGDGQLYLGDPSTFSNHLKDGVIEANVWTQWPTLDLGANRVARVGRMTPTDITPVMMESGEVWLVQFTDAGLLEVVSKIDLSKLILRMMSDDVTGASGRKWLILGVTKAVLDERGRATFAFVRRGDHRSVEWHFMPIDHPLIPPELTGLWDPSRARTTVVPVIRPGGDKPKS